MFEFLRDYSNPSSLGSQFRRKRFKYVESLVRHVLTTQNECTIIDIGGTATYWKLMSAELLKRCVITISNLENVRGGDPRTNVPTEGLFVFHIGDGRDLKEIATDQFDIAHSNSVVEHVGKFSDMESYCKELVRVGRYYYLQTPNVWFPIEPHYGAPFIHWLPSPARARLLSKWNIGFHKRYTSLDAAYNFVEFINLIDQLGVENLLPNGCIRKEKLFLLTKSIISIGPREAVDGLL